MAVLLCEWDGIIDECLHLLLVPVYQTFCSGLLWEYVAFCRSK